MNHLYVNSTTILHQFRFRSIRSLCEYMAITFFTTGRIENP